MPAPYLITMVNPAQSVWIVDDSVEWRPPFYLRLERLQEITGLQDPKEIVKWLQAQEGPLAELDPEYWVHAETANLYQVLEEYAAADRQSGVLSNPRRRPGRQPQSSRRLKNRLITR